MHNAAFSFSGSASNRWGLTLDLVLFTQEIALVAARMAVNPEKTPRPKCLLELVTMFEPRVWEQEPAPRHFKQCMRVFPWPVRKKDGHQSSSSAYCWKGRSAELIRFTDLRRSIACMGMPNPTFERAALNLSEPSPSSMAEYDGSGYTSLHHAAAEGDVGTATYLLEYSASLTVDTPIQVPETPEPRLSDWGNPWPKGHLNHPLSQHTLRDVGLVMSNATPLHIASFFGQEEMVEFLLKKGAKPNAYARIDKYDACRRNTWVDGVTAMYLAIQEEHVGVVKLLIQHGASVFNYVPFSTKAFPLIDLVQWIVGKPTGIVKCWQSAAYSRQSYTDASRRTFHSDNCSHAARHSVGDFSHAGGHTAAEFIATGCGGLHQWLYGCVCSVKVQAWVAWFIFWATVWLWACRSSSAASTWQQQGQFTSEDAWRPVGCDGQLQHAKLSHPSSPLGPAPSFTSVPRRKLIVIPGLRSFKDFFKLTDLLGWRLQLVWAKRQFSRQKRVLISYCC